MSVSITRTSPPFRAEHIGSLKRPAELIQKRSDLYSGKTSPEELTLLEDRFIETIVKMQREVGIKAMTDGEFRRLLFFEGFFDQLEGCTFQPQGAPADHYMDYTPGVEMMRSGLPTILCTGKLKRTKSLYQRQFDGLKKFCTPEETPRLKMTLCPPEIFHVYHGPYTYDKSVYANDEEYFGDIIKAYQEEIKDLYSHGCRNIQFDAPILSFFCSEVMIAGMTAAGVDHEKLLSTYISNYNRCVEGRPADLHVGMHLCRGNFQSGIHACEGGYDRIAEKLFNEANVDTFYLEYDTERAGTFEPLNALPKNKTVVLGLISSKNGELEDLETLRKRVYEAADVIADGNVKRSREEALNQICVSPQCGFASDRDGNEVTEEDVKRKLALVSELARSIWPDA